MSILYPMVAMVFLTLAVFPLVLFTRISAARAGKVSSRYFILFKRENIPDRIVQTSRHLSNLFEAPVLFCNAPDGIAVLVKKIR